MFSDFQRGVFVSIRRKVPPHLRSIEDYYFFSFAASAIFFLSLLTPFLALSGLERLAASAGLCTVLISICLVLWRMGVAIPWVQMIYQTTLMGAILYNAYYSGGVASPVMVWMGIVPILPLFTVSRRWSYVWLTISFSLVIAIYFAQRIGWVPILPHTDPDALAFSATMIGLLTITQVVLVMTYDSANAQTLRYMTRKNEALKTLSQDLQLANVHKDRFLATVSHEMRTPLNAIMGYLGLLKTSKVLPVSSQDYLQGAQNSAAHLLTVINDLLDFSQIQQGKLVFNPQVVDLHLMLTEAHQILAPRAFEKGLQYNLRIDVGVPKWVRIDPHRCTQIMLNLIGNALKYTTQGHVSIRVRYETNDAFDDRGLLCLQVEDTGMGIPAEFYKKIFEPFVQLDWQSHLEEDNALRGNGLGLSITQSLVQNLGGNLCVRSEVGVGSIFEVCLPLQTTVAPQIRRQMRVDETHLEVVDVLLVDDHAVNRLVASATIKQGLPNVRIDEARNGTEAIEKMKSHLYDVVLMDLIMPDYSGVDVVRIIRAECQTPYSEVKVVALTANVGQEAVQACQEVGIDVMLSKPFDREVLIRTILSYANASQVISNA
jgi:signal transduction histidine kinase/CheY-like chemotaxis protein